MKHFKPLLIVVLFCLSQPILAQKIKVSGKVINASNGQAIESVAVVVKSTTGATIPAPPETVIVPFIPP